MNRGIFCVVVFGLFLTTAFTATAQDKPQPPLDPIRQTSPTTIALPADEHRLKPDAEGGLLLLCGDRLALLKEDGITIKREVKLPRHYSDIAARADYFVAVSKRDKVVEIIDRNTYQAVWSKEPPTRAPERIELHPHLPISYISLHGGEGKFIVLDETEKELRSHEGWFGRAVRVDPRGQFMITIVSRLVQVGSRLERLGAHIHEVPDYKPINVMFRYHLHEGRPYMADFREGVGGALVDVCLSPDGLHFVLQSATGYPSGSRNQGIWDALDFETLPETLATKEGGSTRGLAYHPVLPLIASPGEKTALFFNATTGASEATRLTDTDHLPKGLKTDHIAFSPDGLNVLLGGKVGDKRVLVSSKMRLGLTEELWLEQGPPKLEPIELPEVDVPAPDENPHSYEAMAAAVDAWFEADCKAVKNSAFHKDLMRNVKGLLDRGNGFTVLLGSGLVKSGKPTVIGVHNGTFLTETLTAEQAKLVGLGEFNMSVRGGIPYDEDQPYKPVRLRAPKIDPDAGGKIAGQVTLAKNGGLDRGLFGMTLTYFKDDRTTTAIYHGSDWMGAEGGQTKFSFNNPAADAEKPTLIIGYLEMVAFRVSRRNPARVTLSEPVMVIMVVEPEK